MDSRVFWIWLAQALGPGNRATGALLTHFLHAAAIYEAEPEALAAAGITDAACRKLREHSLQSAQAILDATLTAGDWILTPEDVLYPAGLRRLDDLPPVLYCRGTLPDMDTTPALAVVGTRHPTAEGLTEAYALSAGLAAAGMVVVSGGAYGIDAAAHAGALRGGGITVSVMACPLSVNYPAENAALRAQIVENGGALVSEYPPDLPFHCLFPVRNRLLVGLSQGVCLAQTPLRSGARITARLARENGRDVYALPDTPTGHHNDGANAEIRGGATLITCAADIIEEYEALYPGILDREAARQTERAVKGEAPPVAEPAEKRKPTRRAAKPKPAPIPETPPTPEEPRALPEDASDTLKTVYAALTDEPCPVDLLAEKTGLPIPTLLVALTELEMGGYAANSAGQQYRR